MLGFQLLRWHPQQYKPLHLTHLLHLNARVFPHSSHLL